MKNSKVTVEVVQIGKTLYKLLIPHFYIYGDITIDALHAKLEHMVGQGLAQRIQETNA